MRPDPISSPAKNRLRRLNPSGPILLLILLLWSCSKPAVPSVPNPPTDTIPAPPSPPPAGPKQIAFDRTLLLGWWGQYKNGTLNTPYPNPGYNRLYFCPDSIYGPATTLWWATQDDSIHIGDGTGQPNGTASSHVNFQLVSGDTLMTLKYGGISQTYFKVDTPIVQVSPAIYTVAGNGTAGSSGDGGPALQASLNNPYLLARDAAGDLYVCTVDHTIRKISMSTGQISLVGGAPNPNGLFSGDGGPATAASINGPNGMAIDSKGNVYLSDTKYHCIRKISATDGKISTIAGIPGPYGGFSGDEGLASAAQLNGPIGLTIDGMDNLYINDQLNRRIRKISSADSIIHTIAGNGVYGISGDGGPALSASLKTGLFSADAAGNLYLAEYGQTYCTRIRKITAATGIISALAGEDGAGASKEGTSIPQALFNAITGIFIDPNGDLFVADHGNFRVWKCSMANNKITTVAGLGVAGYSDMRFASLAGIVLDPTGQAFIADAAVNRIRKVKVK